MLAVVVVQGVVIGLLGMLVAGLLRSHADILRALHQLGASLEPDRQPPGATGPAMVDLTRRPPGPAAAHDITGATVVEETAALAIVGAREPTLLAFLSSGCHTCQGFWDAFRDPDLAIPGNARLVVVAQDATEENVSRLGELAPPGRTLVLSSAAWADYQVPGSPYFVYVDGRSGRVTGEGTATSWPQVLGLLRQALDHAPDPGRVGPRPGGREDPDPDVGDHVDRELLRAGIGPGHPSLYGGPPTADAEPAVDSR